MLDNIELEGADGSRIKLAAYRGKPCLLIVEGMGSLAQNNAFKKALRQVAEENPTLASRVNLIAVADLGSVKGSPMELAALAAVRLAQQQAPEVKILIDWLGQVNMAFGTKATSSNVFVLDENHTAKLGLQGALAPAQIDKVFERIRGLIV